MALGNACFLRYTFKMLFKKQSIYLDNAAATPCDPSVVSLYGSLQELFYNPGALYNNALTALQSLHDSRSEIAKKLGALPDEIIFARGGTEACNIAVQGLINALYNKNQKAVHVWVNPLEHPAMLEPLLSFAAEKKVILQELPLMSGGIIDISEFKKILTTGHICDVLVCQYVNSEVGTIQPIGDLGRLLLQHSKHTNKKSYFVCDAIQAVNYITIDVKNLHTDLLIISGSKIYGPRSGAALLVKRGTPLQKILQGGGQEMGVRPGTEDVISAAQLAQALNIATNKLESENDRLSDIQLAAFEYILKTIPEVIINGNINDRICNNINISIPNCDSEYMVLALDKAGFMVSSQSACSAKSGARSRIIKKLWELDNIPASYLYADIRISMGRTTKLNDVIKCIDEIKKISNNWHEWNTF